jgi:uncharacterized membrane protein
VNWKTLFILIFIFNIILSIFSASILPDRVAIHFSFGGIADSWASKYIHSLVFTLVNFLLFFLLYYTPNLILLFPPQFINLPSKSYWLKAANRENLLNKLSVMMWEFGTVIFIFLLMVQLLVIQANLNNPVRLHEKTFLLALGLFILYTIYWTVKMYQTFRVPPDQSNDMM